MEFQDDLFGKVLEALEGEGEMAEHFVENDELFSDILKNGVATKPPSTKTAVESKTCFFNFTNQYMAKTIFISSKIGTNKLNIAKKGMFLGDT